jgi:hypothetical protein
MMWRKVLAIVAVGLLVSGLFGDVLAKKPPIRGKGNPTKWGEPGFGDPDWPAFSNVFPWRRAVDIRFGEGAVPSQNDAGRRAQAGHIRREGQKHRWPSRLFEVRLFGRTIASRRH